MVIFGGAGGIGAATARRLAARGATVVLGDVDSSGLAEVTASVNARGGRAAGWTVDVTEREQVREFVDRAVTEFGKLDVLVNSAGVMYVRPIREVDVDEWETTVDLNLKGTLWGTAAALPVFLAQGYGQIVNLGSIHGTKVFPGGAVHYASKYAVRAFSEGLRAELASSGIRVTTVAPGAVDTGMQDKTTGTDRTRMREIYAHAMSPHIVAETIAFAIEQPAEVSINELVVRPTTQEI